jgi:hypothetical protein
MNGVLAAEAPNLGTLLRGQPDSLHEWVEGWNARRAALCVGAIIVGAGCYGAAMGWWRAPRQGLYVAIKFPLIILLTTVANSLLNAMLAPLLGLNLRPRQCFMAILMSFAIASAILGAFSPLAAFVIWNAPPLSTTANPWGTYYFTQLMHVVVIAFAGITANLRLVQLLRHLSGNASVARRVLFAWLAGNLFLGSQLSWVLRPFMGSPGLDIEFLRRTAFQGNFYETVFHAFVQLMKID